LIGGFTIGPNDLNNIVMRIHRKSVQIQLRFTLIAFYSAPENIVAAFRANIAGFLVLNPFFGTNLAPIWNSAQNNPFANSHGKIFNMMARKFVALMTPGESFLFCAIPDPALTTMHKPFI
jgi:ApbE superfamily uncharacterized protein (UPF0280 family)